MTDTKVYVLDMHGHPLMPCSPRKARLLLNQKRARVAKRTPFTIRLLYGSTHYTQDIILGVDAGSRTIGLSASTKEEELFAAEVKPRNDVVDLMSARYSLRHSRRNRTTRYRKKRFSNRVRSKHKGWLAPSVEVKIREHVTSVKRTCAVLPVKKMVVETAEFDLQLLKAVENGNPVPVGEDYQKGEMLGQYNVRQYVLYRDGYRCRCCKKHGNGIKLHIHHLESRKTGGDAPDNLITLCEDCHGKYHKGIITNADLGKRVRRSTRDAAFMGIMRKTLMHRLRQELSVPVRETKGYITKYTRVERMDLPKSHVNDALAIAHGPAGFGNAGTSVKRAGRIYLVRPVRHHNRQLHKINTLKGGIRKSNQAAVYVKGYRLYDKVEYNGTECFVWGRRTSGHFLLKKLDGAQVHAGVSYKKLRLLERSSGYLIA